MMQIIEILHDSLFLITMLATPTCFACASTSRAHASHIPMRAFRHACHAFHHFHVICVHFFHVRDVIIYLLPVLLHRHGLFSAGLTQPLDFLLGLTKSPFVWGCVPVLEC